MAVNCRFLVNLLLLGFPITVTLAVLISLQKIRSAAGQAPLFKPQNPLAGGPNGVTQEITCEQFAAIQPTVKQGQQYTLNPNQWNWQGDKTGGLCMRVFEHNNGTYGGSAAPAFSATWKYPKGEEKNPVHAFPNARLDTDVLPVRLKSLAEVNLDLDWAYVVGDKKGIEASDDEEELDASDVNASVFMHMSVDKSPERAQNLPDAEFEVRIWFGSIGKTPTPIGVKGGPIAIQVVEGIQFYLYKGENGLKKQVLTWFATETAGNFTGDILPMLTAFSETQLDDLPTSKYYIGYMAFGSEAFAARKTVTFNVPRLAVDVQTIL